MPSKRETRNPPKPKRKGRNPPKPKFDPSRKPTKPKYPPMPKVWRSAEEYWEWENQCEKLRYEWEKDIEEWKALHGSDSEWESCDSEEDVGEIESFNDPQWGPHPTYAAAVDHGLGPDDPRMPNEQLMNILSPLLEVLVSYSNAQIQPSISNVFDALEGAKRGVLEDEADEKAVDLLLVPRMVATPADVPEAAASSSGPRRGARIVKRTEKAQKNYRPSLSV